MKSKALDGLARFSREEITATPCENLPWKAHQWSIEDGSGSLQEAPASAGSGLIGGRRGSIMSMKTFAQRSRVIIQSSADAWWYTYRPTTASDDVSGVHGACDADCHMSPREPATIRFAAGELCRSFPGRRRKDDAGANGTPEDREREAWRDDMTEDGAWVWPWRAS